jgi:hypothetical protein
MIDDHFQVTKKYLKHKTKNKKSQFITKKCEFQILKIKNKIIQLQMI